MVDLAFALDGDDRIRASVMIANDPGQPDGGPHSPGLPSDVPSHLLQRFQCPRGPTAYPPRTRARKSSGTSQSTIAAATRLICSPSVVRASNRDSSLAVSSPNLRVARSLRILASHSDPLLASHFDSLLASHFDPLLSDSVPAAPKLSIDPCHRHRLLQLIGVESIRT